ncbi:MAG TPA: type II toxin-antitoxin system RelE/ParE family toxin [Longimicrobium sp.]|nr:type II toxin-antitoxin system RelE/ParE family toxin [Longimicrobium sp.]
MGARVRWSRNAQREVTKIRQYIERDSKAKAVQVVGQFVFAAKRLSTFPLSGHIIKPWNHPARRELIVGSYRLMYQVSPIGIVVFSIRHTRRRIPKRFRNDWLR